MKALSAVIKLDIHGTETTLEYPEMKIKDLAHELIEIAQPSLDIAVTDAKIEEFHREAKKEYINSKVFNDYDAYVDLYVRMKTDAYIRLEHAKQAYNDAVLNYSKLIKSNQNEH